MAAYCLFSALYLPHMGGVERFTDSLARELSSMGHSVSIITSKIGDSPAFETVDENITIYRLDSLPLMDGRLPIYLPSKHNHNVLSGLAQDHFDGVLINTRFYPLSLVGLVFARKCDAPAVVLDHGSAYLTFGNRFLDMFEHLYEHAITFVEKLFHPDFYGISERSCEWLRTFGISAKGVIPNAINAEAFRGQASGRDFRRELGINQDALMLVFTGRLIPEKGIYVLLDVMYRLIDYDIQLVIAGDGPLRSAVECCGLANVHLVGKVDLPDIAALLFQGDLFVLPSRSEGFCTSLLEAYACGLPILSSDVGGARDVIDCHGCGRVLNCAEDDIVRCFTDEIIRINSDRPMVVEPARKERKGSPSSLSWARSARLLLDALKR